MGWRIDIHSETKHDEMLNLARSEIARVGVLDEEQVEVLLRHGFQSAAELADTDAGEVEAILAVTPEFAVTVIDQADEVVGELIMEEASRRKGDHAAGA